MELIRKKAKLKIILIENGGISKSEEVGLDLVQICNNLGISATRIKESEIKKISRLLQKEKLTLIEIDYCKKSEKNI